MSKSKAKPKMQLNYGVDPKKKTGWLFTDVVLFIDCWYCTSKIGEHCTTDNGKKVWPPHKDRIDAYLKTTSLKDYEVKLTTVDEIVDYVENLRESGGTADAPGLEPGEGNSS